MNLSSSLIWLQAPAGAISFSSKAINSSVLLCNKKTVSNWSMAG